MDTNLGKELRQIIKIIQYMLRKGIKLKRKLILDLNLHLKRTKLNSKSFRILNPRMTLFNHGSPLRSCHQHVEFDFDDVMSTCYSGNGSESSSVFPSPSPLIIPSYDGRQGRIMDSPFNVEEFVNDGKVDEKAEDFIKRFYEQLRMQPVAVETPGRLL